MRRGRFARIAGLVVLGLLAVVLYADLQSMHQIYWITDAMINNARDAETRQHLIAAKEVRDREEQRHKMAIGVVLITDVAFFLWVGVSLLRGPGRRTPPQQLTTGN